MDLRHGELTVGELARRSGVPASTIRFYGREELIHSRRTSGNQRRYSQLRRIAFVRALQRIRIRLAAIRDALSLLPLPRGLTPTREDRARGLRPLAR